MLQRRNGYETTYRILEGQRLNLTNKSFIQIQYGYGVDANLLSNKLHFLEVIF